MIATEAGGPGFILHVMSKTLGRQRWVGSWSLLTDQSSIVRDSIRRQDEKIPRKTPQRSYFWSPQTHASCRKHVCICKLVNMYTYMHTNTHKERIADLPLALERRIQKHLISALLYYWHPQEQLDWGEMKDAWYKEEEKKEREWKREWERDILTSVPSCTCLYSEFSFW